MDENEHLSFINKDKKIFWPMNNVRIRIFWVTGTVVYLFLLPFFFWKYVPFVAPFLQITLLLSGLLLGITLYRREWGVLFFVFLFPLVNSLPYFWGINLNVPHAPVALVLFLILFLGLLIRASLYGERFLAVTSLNSILGILAVLIILSGLITFFRFTAFFPFQADGLYEFKTNVLGVTSGGALMSTLFSALNYLCGFTFFLLLYQIISPNQKKTRIGLFHFFIALTASTIIASLLGLFQRYTDLSWGNTSFWVTMNQINSTFKDPNAFAFFLSGTIPLFIGLVLDEKAPKKIFFLLGLLFSIIVFPFIGNRSAFLGLVVALIIIFALRVKPWWIHFQKKFINRFALRLSFIISVLIILIGVILAGVIFSRQARLFHRLTQGITEAIKARSLYALSPERYFLWREAGLMMKDYPLSGVGLGAFIIELPNYYLLNPGRGDKGFKMWQRNDSAENYFLHIGAEMGVIVLGFFVWLFWLIFRRAKYVYQTTKQEKAFSLSEVKIGLIAGLAACLINFLFHSYIGSFESKFLFWLMVALLFSGELGSGNFRRKFKEKVVFLNLKKRRVFILVTIVILIFVVSGFWQATHSLSLGYRTQLLHIPQSFGWYNWEKDQIGHEFQWSRSYGGRMIEIDPSKLRFEVLASHPDIQQKPVKVKVFLIRDFFKEKILLSEFVLDEPQWETKELFLPEKLKGEEVIILFKVSRTWIPSKTLAVPDPRRLGVAVTKFEY